MDLANAKASDEPEIEKPGTLLARVVVANDSSPDVAEGLLLNGLWQRRNEIF